MSATRGEVLRAMAQSIAYREGIRPISAKKDDTYLAYEGHAQAALAAAEQAGWVLVPVVADEGILHVMDLCASGKVVMSKQEAWHNMLAAAPKVGEP